MYKDFHTFFMFLLQPIMEYSIFVFYVPHYNCVGQSLKQFKYLIFNLLK